MLIFVVARTRLDRYEELCCQFGEWPDVRIILDRREGERRAGNVRFAGLNRRHRDRRRVEIGIDAFVKLGWSVSRHRRRHALLSDLADFIADHRAHAALIADATELAWNGYLLTVACRVGLCLSGV